MEETKIEIKETIKTESKINYLLKQFIYNPFLAGISGFTSFFLFAILMDFIVNLANPDRIFSIDILTVLIGIAGFMLAFSFSFLENTQNKDL